MRHWMRGSWRTSRVWLYQCGHYRTFDRQPAPPRVNGRLRCCEMPRPRKLLGSRTFRILRAIFFSRRHSSISIFPDINTVPRPHSRSNHHRRADRIFDGSLSVLTKLRFRCEDLDKARKVKHNKPPERAPAHATILYDPSISSLERS